MPLLSNGLLTSETTIVENPELVRRMVQATLRGIRFTIAYPEETFEISTKFVEELENADTEVQMGVLEASIELYQRDPLGYSDIEAWQNMQEVLLDIDLIESPLDLSAAFANDPIKE